MASENGCPLEIHKIEIDKCDEMYDEECQGETSMPFYRANYDPSSGQSPNSPREQVCNKLNGWLSRVLDQLQDWHHCRSTEWPLGSMEVSSTAIKRLGSVRWGAFRMEVSNGWEGFQGCHPTMWSESHSLTLQVLMLWDVWIRNECLVSGINRVTLNWCCTFVTDLLLQATLFVTKSYLEEKTLCRREGGQYLKHKAKPYFSPTQLTFKGKGRIAKISNKGYKQMKYKKSEIFNIVAMPFIFHIL